MSNRRSRSSEGRGSVPLIAFIVVAATALWFGGRLAGSRTGRAAIGTERPAGGDDGYTHDVDAALAEVGRSSAGARGDSVLGGTGNATGERFDGMGSLRGHVEVSGDTPFPMVWSLTLVPSLTLVGREYAVERTVEFTDGRKDFEVRGLPLAGYDVLAHADGMNALRAPILLERGSESPYVNIRMIPAGRIDGRVLDHNGLPAEGVLLTLLKLPARDQRIEFTNALGEFFFAKVLDGRYQVIVGTLASPIQKDSRTIRVQSPGLTLPDIELRPLGALELVISEVDDQRLLAGVTVRGSGSNGGAFELESDGWGMITARYLPPGTWRIRLELEGYRGRRDSFVIEAVEMRQLSLQLLRQ